MKLVSRVAVAMLLVACRPTPTGVTSAVLASDVVARVGDVAVPATLVGAVAAARGIPPAEAVHLLIDDAVAAEGARRGRLDQADATAFQLDQCRARIAVARLREQAWGAGPPTTAELAEITEARWREVDRPESIRVFHAVILRRDVPALDEEGKRIASAVAAAVAGAKNEQDFEARARPAVPEPRAKDLRVEVLTPFVADGRYTEGPPQGVDLAFATGAFRIPEVGGTSPVVESKFGFHVILLLERIPARIVPPPERLALFAEPILTERARDALDALMAAAHQRLKVEQSPAAEALMTDFVRAQAPAPD